MRATTSLLAAVLAIPATVAAQEGELVEGAVYRCDLDGVRRYSARPIKGAACSAINYSFVQETGLPAWVLMAEGNDGMRSYYRADDVKRSGQRVTLWILESHPEEKFVPNTGIGTFQSSIQRMEVDCEERTYLPIQAAFYAGRLGEGDVAGTLTVSTLRSRDRRYAVPGSMGQKMVDIVCALEP